MTGKGSRRWSGPFVVSAARVHDVPVEVRAPRAFANAASVDVAPLQPATSAANASAVASGLATSGPETRGLHTHDLETDGVETDGVEANDLEADDLETDDLEANDPETNDLGSRDPQIPACGSIGLSTTASEETEPSAPPASRSTTVSGTQVSDAIALGRSIGRTAPFEPRRAQRASPPRGTDHRERAGADPGLGSVGCGAAAAAIEPVLAPARRALVVDDDPEVRRALARFLRPDLEVSLAGSVSEAKAIVAQLDRLDVAFVDWELPDGTGEQVLEWLSRWPDAIRVLISGRFASSSSPPQDLVQPAPSGDVSSVARGPGAGAPGEGGRDGSGAHTGEKARERSSEDVLKNNPLKNRALANLVLGKPLAPGVLDALKRAALALPND